MAVRLWNGEAYPRARLDRRELALEGEDPFAEVARAIPRARLWPFHINEVTVGQRATVVSPRFVGPAILKELVLIPQITGVGATEGVSFALRYSTAPATAGANQADTAPPAGTSIFENFSQATDQAGFVFNDPSALPLRSSFTDGTVHHLTLNFPIRLPEFFLALSLDTQSVNANRITGYVRLFENVAPEDFAILLGG